MQKLIFKKFYRKENGFTLVETLVAISIFTASILALMSVLTQSIASTTYAKEKMTATYLAQEGIEYMRNLRDTAILYYDPNNLNDQNSPNGWTQFHDMLFFGSCGAASGCYFDDQRNIQGNSFDMFAPSSQPQPITQILVTACPSGNCPMLKFDKTSGKYGYATGVSSGFVRKLQATQVSVNEIKVLSTVSWVQGSGAYSITFSENFFNWIEQ